MSGFYDYPGTVPPPPPPPMGPPAAQKSPLPTVSLVLGILSIVIFCAGIVLGIAAIITGAIGRGKAKAAGSGTGTALAGIITGAVGVIVGVVSLIMILAGGVGIVGFFSQHMVVAEQLDAASFAAKTYGTDKGSYSGITTEGLSAYGYTPSGDVAVTAVPVDGGSNYCVSGYLKSDPGNVIHMPANPNALMTITINGKEYRYSFGGCPAG